MVGKSCLWLAGQLCEKPVRGLAARGLESEERKRAEGERGRAKKKKRCIGNVWSESGGGEGAETGKGTERKKGWQLNGMVRNIRVRRVLE